MQKETITKIFMIGGGFIVGFIAGGAVVKLAWPGKLGGGSV